MKSLFFLALIAVAASEPVTVTPALLTAPVSADADDPAIWVHPKDPARSIVFGTDKLKEKGGIYAFNLDGKIVQRIENLDRPNNCDVEYGLGSMDILVATERLKHRLKVYSIDRESGKLSDISGQTELFQGEVDSKREAMGVGLYKNPSNGRIFAFVSRTEGLADGYLGQYELLMNPTTKLVDAKFVRTFGKFSGKKEIESVFVDDELGFVYYSDETSQTQKYAVDKLDQPLTAPDTTSFKGDQEGIALYSTGPGTGYLVCTEQIAGNSVYHVYDRVTSKALGSFRGGIDDTDGIEIVSASLGSKFPKGLFVAMNSGPKNFAFVDWRQISSALKLPNGIH
jgi:3-phytase